ncbi:MAG: 5-amino-6-(D-ribitylamino)uracil--L-tyrosine 4-hydroxyphenyl transferase CofH [Actinomycetota bacterium]|nr:5-amino-6-(D-ribitylamino)uracil--L-tyrosine 4-hydroxyphenyl transferase CofH [Actinomycetota bacterium]
MAGNEWAEAMRLAASLESEDVVALLERARETRDRAWGNVVTYSPKVFIPLTKLCRDVCHYCTFARPPVRGRRAYMTIDEVLEVAEAGAAAGCKEALFTLGDKPELRYRAAREELCSMGFRTTLEYLGAAAKAVLEKTGLLPHLNPGLMTPDDLSVLRDTAPSMGIMLESTSRRLLQRGFAHHGSPDKDPDLRLATIREAGRQKIPFTTGILIGIGETFTERAGALIAIEQAHREHGHIQEVIIQNFRAKPGTLMHGHPEPDLDDMVRTIAVARLILSPEVSLQAPPNLAGAPGGNVQAGDGNTDLELQAYLRAGINDWGGVSPVTPDYVNPEAPWPAVEHLRAVTESCGLMLVPRLTVYPRYALDREWVSSRVRPHVLSLADTEGLSRDLGWFPGEAVSPPDVISAPFWWSGMQSVPVRPELARALDSASAGEELTEGQITALFTARGPELVALAEAADELRRTRSGDVVTFVVNRNINYTNMCYFKCGFCAFSKGPKSLNLRGDPYLLDLEEIARRSVEAYEAGATEVCLQGGIHPSFTGDFYVGVLRAIKDAVPGIHVHAFSPLEVWQGAATKGVPLRDFLWELKDNGLSTLPGTAAEILDDEVRAIICPDKITTGQWSEVARTAHALGLRMTSTIMFGHADTYRSWARHLIVLREIQKSTGGFTEFVPLPFVHMAAPIYLKGRARRGPTFEEALKMHSVARLALDPWITNIQVSWVKMGPDGAQLALKAGCNDLGGTLMNEIISRSAGASHGQELGAEEMKRLAGELGRPWAQRTTLYEILEMA